MKCIINIMLVFLLFSCSKIKKEESKLLISKTNFSVSVFNKKLDSINKKDSLEVISNKYDKRLNKNYSHGFIHFLILDNNTSYYALDTVRPRMLMCGNRPEFSEEDSIRFVQKSNKFIDNIKSIKTSEIIKVLKQNKDFIINKEYSNPLNVSFALKNDTLKGATIYNVVNFMENNGMKLYTFRRMNEYEIMKTK